MLYCINTDGYDVIESADLLGQVSAVFGAVPGDDVMRKARALIN
jgi:hypothetical protein